MISRTDESIVEGPGAPIDFVRMPGSRGALLCAQPRAAVVHTSDFLSAEPARVMSLEVLPRVQQNGHRTFVDQLHLHHLLEASGLAAEAGRADAFNEKLI